MKHCSILHQTRCLLSWCVIHANQRKDTPYRDGVWRPPTGARSRREIPWADKERRICARYQRIRSVNNLLHAIPASKVGVVTYRYHDSRLRVSSILLISAEDFELDGPSIASYGLDSIIGAEMKNWSFKEVGLEFSFQNLLSPSLTFGGLAEVVSMHLGVIPATD